MRMLCGVLIVTLGLSVASASRAAQTNTQPRPTTDNYRSFMKTVGTTYPSMQKHLMAGMTAEAAKEAQVLAETFGNVERFWTQNNKPEAIKLAQQARAYATETAGAATAGDATKATGTATNMQGMCKQCHGLYREMDPANPGGFRIKPGVIAGSFS